VRPPYLWLSEVHAGSKPIGTRRGANGWRGPCRRPDCGAACAAAGEGTPRVEVKGPYPPRTYSERNFAASSTDKLWVDITYIRTEEGRFPCLASGPNVRSRRIVGWAMVSHPRILTRGGSSSWMASRSCPDKKARPEPDSPLGSGRAVYVYIFRKEIRGDRRHPAVHGWDRLSVGQRHGRESHLDSTFGVDRVSAFPCERSSEGSRLRVHRRALQSGEATLLAWPREPRRVEKDRTEEANAA
jgi:hypothetical protein